jgi:uncharacterized protein YaaW (UPF0174 family)
MFTQVLSIILQFLSFLFVSGRQQLANQIHNHCARAFLGGGTLQSHNAVIFPLNHAAMRAVQRLDGAKLGWGVIG